MSVSRRVTAGMPLDVIYAEPCGALAEVADESTDCVVTSPPWNLSMAAAQPGKLHNMVGYGAFSDRLPQDEYERQQVEVLNACARVVKPCGSIFYNHKPRACDGVEINPVRWVDRSECEIYQTIVQDRGSTHNHDRKHLWPRYEFVLHLKKRGCLPRINEACADWGNLWRLNWSETRLIGHPAPFPEELVYRCLSLADVPVGGIVLDPFCGSGTTLLVATEMGMHFIGYEIEPTYIRLAEHRIQAARQRMEISGPLTPPRMREGEMCVDLSRAEQ